MANNIKVIGSVDPFLQLLDEYGEQVRNEIKTFNVEFKNKIENYINSNFPRKTGKFISMIKVEIDNNDTITVSTNDKYSNHLWNIYANGTKERKRTYMSKKQNIKFKTQKSAGEIKVNLFIKNFNKWLEKEYEQDLLRKFGGN